MPLEVRSAADRPLVVFDFDGTLADTWRDIAHALNATLADAGLGEVTGPDVKSWIGDGALKLLQRALPAQEASEGRFQVHARRFFDRYERCCLDTTDLYPGVRECLEALSGQPLAVLSNKPERFLTRVIEGLDIGKFFFVALGGDSLEVQKPDPATLQRVTEHLDRAPESVWMVGDSGVDVTTGRAAGARTIGCSWGLRDAAELRAAGADFLVDDAREIPPLVLGR